MNCYQEHHFQFASNYERENLPSKLSAPCLKYLCFCVLLTCLRHLEETPISPVTPFWVFSSKVWPQYRALRFPWEIRRLISARVTDSFTPTGCDHYYHHHGLQRSAARRAGVLHLLCESRNSDAHGHPTVRNISSEHCFLTSSSPIRKMCNPQAALWKWMRFSMVSFSCCVLAICWHLLIRLSLRIFLLRTALKMCVNRPEVSITNSKSLSLFHKKAELNG